METYKYTNKFQLLSELINNSSKILLSTHVNPDGDGLGSEVAMYHYLNSIGKDCRIINNTITPEKYDFINVGNIIEYHDCSQDEWIKSIDIAIVFDIGDYRRLNELYPLIGDKKMIIFDHHPPVDNSEFKLSIIDMDAPATGYMVWKYLQYTLGNNFTLDKAICNALYTAVITDTGSFRYQSTNSDTHLMAAHLIDNGLKPYEIHHAVFEQRPLEQVKLLGKVINGLNFASDGKISWFVLTKDMQDEVGAKKEHIDGFTEFVRTIIDVEVSFMIQEVSNNSFRINFRSTGNHTVNDIAKTYGGGGHKFAAGAKVDNISFEELELDILSKVKAKIKD